MNIKKIVMSLGLCFILSFSSVAFADTISIEYIDLMLEKMNNRTDREIQDIRFSLKSIPNLELTKTNYSKNLTEHQKSELKRLNITDSQVKANLEALKSWSKEDRTELIILSQANNKEAIVALNDKYKSTSSTSSNSSSSSGSSNSSGGSSGSTAGGSSSTPNTTETAVIQTTKSNKSLLKEGIRSNSIEVKEELALKKFDDTNSHWANSNILFFAKRGIVNGRQDGNFYPDEKINKAEIIKIVSNVFVEDESKLELSKVGYKDISSNDWYYNYVKNLTSLGVLTDGDNLQPLSNPQRQEIIDLMIKTLKASDIPVDQSSIKINDEFRDKDKIDSKYRESMSIALDLGIIKGMGNGMLSPESEVTRAEVMTMTKNLYDYIMKYLN